MIKLKKFFIILLTILIGCAILYYTINISDYLFNVTGEIKLPIEIDFNYYSEHK